MASHNKIMLDAIEAVLQKRATSDLLSYTINGRTIQKHSMEELEILHAKYLEKVNIEEDQERVATGKPSKRSTRVKF